MTKHSASASRVMPVRRAPRTRSAVTNGRRVHVVPVGDTAWSRRFRDVLAEIISDLGGSDGLSEGQRQLARRAATISLECEKLEAKAVGGVEIDLEVFGQLTDRLGRAFGRLGLKRAARDVTPSLAEYIAQTYGEGDEETVAHRLTEAGDESDVNPAPEATAAGTLPSESATVGAKTSP
jgi:hypothetical protein